MDKVLQCDCGFNARAEDEDGLVAEIRRHAREAHAMELSHDDALGLVFRAELDANLPSTTTRKPTIRTHKEER